MLGTFFIFKHSGTLDFLGTFAQRRRRFAEGDATSPPAASCCSSARSRSRAQIPLHTWLPDAMEGPTPVSALIHAATMVTAGVYLIARMHPLFEQAPGGRRRRRDHRLRSTLLVAGTIGLVVTDLKRVIAYSTMSQIGYMIMARQRAAPTSRACSTS